MPVLLIALPILAWSCHSIPPAFCPMTSRHPARSSGPHPGSRRHRRWPITC
jgi:hypothetical protein